VLGDDLDALSNQVGRVETDTELTDHGNIGTSAEGLHESLGSGLGDGSEVVDQIGLGHTDTGITDAQDVVLAIRGDANVELLLRVELGGVGEGLVADLVEGICLRECKTIGRKKTSDLVIVPKTRLAQTTSDENKKNYVPEALETNSLKKTSLLE
jgi:hypothetical protein